MGGPEGKALPLMPLFLLFVLYQGEVNNLVDWLIGSTGGFVAASDPAFGFAPFN